MSTPGERAMKVSIAMWREQYARAEKAEAEVVRLGTLHMDSLARAVKAEAELEAGDACGAVGCRALADRDALAAVVDRVRVLHAPLGTTLVATADDLLGSNWQDVEPDSFEEITSRDEVCMACAGYPTWPCPTARALGGDA